MGVSPPIGPRLRIFPDFPVHLNNKEIPYILSVFRVSSNKSP